MTSAAETRRLAANPFRAPTARELRREQREHEAAWQRMTPAARAARTAELERELAELDGTAPAEPPAPAPAGGGWEVLDREVERERAEYDAILAQVIANVPPGYFWDADGILVKDPPERGALAVAARRCPVCGHPPRSPCHTMTASPQPRKRPHPKRSALIAWPPP